MHAHPPNIIYPTRYAVRVAVIDLDAPPTWFAGSAQARDHMTAAQAREFAGTAGARARCVCVGGRARVCVCVCVCI
jgi:hypothetical protein